MIQLEIDILDHNNQLAHKNAQYFLKENIFTLNMVSSPGSGKTSVLERTIKDLKEAILFSVIEGDQQTSNDAIRIKNAGASAVQINTGQACHLDSEMIQKAVSNLQPPPNSILFIENVGNLVCPAMFQLGESKRVVVISVTEGDDKPIKYPDMFASSDICLINKIDLLPYVDFNIDTAKKYALSVNHQLEFIEVSAKTGAGMNKWYDFLKTGLSTKTL